MEPCEASKTPYILSEFILILEIAVYFWQQYISFLELYPVYFWFSFLLFLVLVLPFCWSGCEMFPD